MKRKAKRDKYFYVVKPQKGNIHGLIPQPPVKKFNMNERDTHSIQSTLSLTTRLSESPTLLPTKVCPTPLENNSLSKALKPLGRFPSLAI